MATERDDDQENRRRILARASAASGIDFAGYRETVMVRRIDHRAMATSSGSLEEYLHRLDAEPGEVHRLVDALLIKTTELFREHRTLERLRAALPALIERRVTQGETQLRAWVAGCSTGEEAFSLACVLLAATEGPQRSSLSIRVFGSDADPRAIEQARRGVVVCRLGTPSVPAWAQRWFNPSAEGLAVEPPIRAITSFSCHDLLDELQPVPPDAVVASFDVIACRNVLIYLDGVHRSRVLRRLVTSVEEAGLLLLGDAESMPPEETELTRVDPAVPLYARAPSGVS